MGGKSILSVPFRLQLVVQNVFPVEPLTLLLHPCALLAAREVLSGVLELGLALFYLLLLLCYLSLLLFYLLTVLSVLFTPLPHLHLLLSTRLLLLVLAVMQRLDDPVLLDHLGLQVLELLLHALGLFLPLCLHLLPQPAHLLLELDRELGLSPLQSLFHLLDHLALTLVLLLVLLDLHLLLFYLGLFVLNLLLVGHELLTLFLGYLVIQNLFLVTLDLLLQRVQLSLHGGHLLSFLLHAGIVGLLHLLVTAVLLHHLLVLDYRLMYLGLLQFALLLLQVDLFILQLDLLVVLRNLALLLVDLVLLLDDLLLQTVLFGGLFGQGAV